MTAMRSTYLARLPGDRWELVIVGEAFPVAEFDVDDQTGMIATVTLADGRRFAGKTWDGRDWRRWAEVRDVADTPPPGALAPTSSYGCGDTACVPCYGNREWQAWNAHREGVCYLCGEEYGHPDGHDADEECHLSPDRSEPTSAELAAWCARNLY